MFIILLNGLTIVLGTLLGYIFRKALPKDISESIIKILGLFTFIMGLKDALTFKNGMYVAIYLVIGVVIGEKFDLDGKLKNLGKILQEKFGKEKEEGGMIKGFVTSTLIFCVGSMAILGPVKIALNGDGNLIYIKSILDGVMSMMLASTYGIGVMFSGIMVVIYQGLMFCMGNVLKVVTTPEVMGDVTAVGGAILTGLGLTLIFGEKYLKVTNMLPGMFLPIIFSLIIRLF